MWWLVGASVVLHVTVAARWLLQHRRDEAAFEARLAEMQKRWPTN